MCFKSKILKALIVLAVLVFGLAAFAADEIEDRVPSLSNALRGHVNEDDLKPMPESYQHESVLDPSFLDLSGDPDATVKFPGGADKFKGLKKVD